MPHSAGRRTPGLLPVDDEGFTIYFAHFPIAYFPRMVNSSENDQVPAQFRRWMMAGGKQLTALKRRREREIEMSFDGLPKPKAVPSPGENLEPIDIRKGES